MPLPVVVEKAHGALICDVDGNVFIDFASAANGAIVGHTPEGMDNALAEQADAVTHIYDRLGISENYVRLCELLNEITPDMGGTKRSILFPNQYAAWGGATTVLQNANPPSGVAMGNFTFPMKEMDDRHLKATAGIGFVYDPASPLAPDKVERAAAHYRARGDLIYADEIFTGFGLTGKMFAVEHYPLRPDLMILGGGMGTGLPLCALTGRADIMPRVEFQEQEVDSLQIRAALWTIEFIQSQGLVARANQIGDVVLERIAEWQATFPKAITVHRLGALLTLELDHAPEVVEAARQQGLLLLANALKFILLRYPLMIPEEQLNEGLDILERALRSLLG